MVMVISCKLNSKVMKKSVRCIPQFVTALGKYIESNDINELISDLYAMQDDIIEDFRINMHKPANQGKNVWFRFFKNDTGAATISNIETELCLSTRENRNYMLENFKIAIANPKDVQIYFS